MYQDEDTVEFKANNIRFLFFRSGINGMQAYIDRFTDGTNLVEGTYIYMFRFGAIGTC